MKIRSWTAGLAIATLAAVAPAASAETTNTSIPLAGELLNDCIAPAEAVTIQGTLHIKSTVNLTLDGAKTQEEFNTSGFTGTTVLGVKYSMNQQMSDMQHASGDDGQSTVEQTITMTRQGETGLSVMGGDDFRFHSIVHLTTVNGVTKASQVEFRSDCR